MNPCTTSQSWLNAQYKTIETIKRKLQERIDSYNLNPKRCKKCNKQLEYQKRNNDYCNHTCSALHNNHYKGLRLTNEEKEKIAQGVLNSPNYKTMVESIKNRMPKRNIKWICPICEKEILVTEIEAKNKKYCSRECYNQDLKNEKRFCKTAPGGFREKGGRGKQGKYKGILCQSTYELVWVIYNIDHNTPFQRNWNSFKYIFEGKEHKFYPDFFCNNEYIEIKGFMRNHDYEKIKQFPLTEKIKLLMGKDLQTQFDYVLQKYKKDLNHLEELYDK